MRYHSEVLSLRNIRTRLAAHEPERFEPHAGTRQAAVAVVLRQTDAGAEVLFIQRSERDGDPWSGHMAFPGGHREPHDKNLMAASMRETFEEIGLELAEDQLIGELDQQRASPRGRPLNMLVAPYVFEIDGDPTFAPNYEVAEVVWGPLAPMHQAENHTLEQRIVGGTPTSFNGYRLAGGHFGWGMTYRMMKTFFEVLDPEFEHPDIE